MKSKIMKINSEVAPATLEFTFDDNKYLLCDFENQWTLKQQQIAKPLLKEIFSKLFTKDITDNLNENENSTMINLVSNTLDLDIDAELLALIYLDEGETKFNLETYKQRVKDFEDLTEKELVIANKGLQSFFSIKVPLILRSSQTILTATAGIGQV